MDHIRLHRGAAVAACALALSGCAGMQMPFASKAPAEVARASQSFKVPSVDPIGKAPETQRRGPVVISVATVPFTPKAYELKYYKELPTVLVMNDQYSYELKTVQRWSVTPILLSFKIRIINNGDDILRLSGVLVRFNLDGKDYALDAESSGLRSLVDGVLAPQEQKEFELAAAPAEKLRDGANLSLRVYGIATGSASEKGNYEWTYRVKQREEAREAAVTTQKVSLRHQEAMILEARERKAEQALLL